MKPKEGYKMMRKLFSKRTYIVLGILCCIFIWLQFETESFAFTRTTGEVTGSSVKVRETAGTESEVVASVRAGDELDVVDAVNGTDGKVWYKVVVSADEYGYIRSDFVTLDGGAQSPSTSTSTTITTTPGAVEQPSEVTPMDKQNGHTNTNNVKVRQQASTNSAEVDRLNQDQVFSITGTAQGPDSKVWYQVSYIDNGTAMNGFIRSDLVTLMEKEEELPEGEVIQVEEDTPDEKPTEQEESTPVKTYEAVYTTDENGDYVWYLYNRAEGQRYKIDQLLKVDSEKKEEMEELSSANFGLKIALIIVICFLVMLLVAVAFYFLKMKEEEEENSYKRAVANATQATARRSTAAGNVRTQNTVRTQTAVKTQSGEKTQQTANVKSASMSQTTLKASSAQPERQPVRNSVTGMNTVGDSGQAQKQKTSWKAKNFLEDNDEFEFGFLDFDEDDE